MILKKLLPFVLIAFSTFAFAQEPATKVKFYGYVGNEFFYNSRQNQEMVDGAIFLFPKPVSLNSTTGKDNNAIPQAEMLSVNTRLGLDINGTPVLGAKSTGKIEADFAGFGTNFYVFRIRQAYVKLNWDKTELLVGQTWHPLFGSVAPSTPSANGGAPFQPFNRSPQVRVKQNLTNTLTVTGAALYEMQYASMGALGTSNVYLKNSLLPDLFVGLENKTAHWTTGIGADIKRLKLLAGSITSKSAVAYAQYNNKLLTVKGKALYGQNLTDQLMIGGYAVSGIDATTNDTTYTNIKTATGWLNVTYGSKIQVGILGGYSRNLGTQDDLVLNAKGQYIAYGYGFTSKTQSQLNELIRIAPTVSYNLPNLKFALEYDYTTAAYGTLQSDGLVATPTWATNHRVLASVSYIF
ncbi:MAG: hypothetical protein QM800_00505 [Paludibacter sp.]